MYIIAIMNMGRPIKTIVRKISLKIKTSQNHKNHMNDVILLGLFCQLVGGGKMRKAYVANFSRQGAEGESGDLRAGGVYWAMWG